MDICLLFVSQFLVILVQSKVNKKSNVITATKKEFEPGESCRQDCRGICCTKHPSSNQKERAKDKKNVGSKRQSSSQTTTFSSPSREHASSKLRITDTNTLTIGDLKVSVVLVQPKYGEEWYQGVFLTTLSTKQRCFLKTSKDIWLGRQCDVVMSKLREKIVQKAEEAGYGRPSEVK